MKWYSETGEYTWDDEISLPHINRWAAGMITHYWKKYHELRNSRWRITIADEFENQHTAESGRIFSSIPA
jgi:hypothetical protein